MTANAGMAIVARAVDSFDITGKLDAVTTHLVDIDPGGEIPSLNPEFVRNSVNFPHYIAQLIVQPESKWLHSGIFKTDISM